MIARNLQELADAVNVLEQRMIHAGFEESEHHPWEFRRAEAFAEELRLVSNDDQAWALIRAQPKNAGAFFPILRSVREELEKAGADISAVPDVPLLLYAPVADAVAEAVRAYRRKRPYIPLLLRQLQASGEEFGDVR